MRLALLVLLWLAVSGVVLLLTVSVLRGGHAEDVRLGYDEDEWAPEAGRARQPGELPPPRRPTEREATVVRPHRPDDGAGGSRSGR